MSARQLGPRQKPVAKTSAQHIRFWAADLEKAIADDDIDTAEHLAAAITSQIAAITQTLTTAKPIPLRVCTCGASDYVSCLCELSPREWLEYAKTNPNVDQGLTLPKGLQ